MQSRDRAKKIALIALMTATIEGGKLALSFIPNVEIVTLLCALYGYTFGWSGIIATYLFSVIESLVWGFNTWVFTYFIYWPLVAFVFMTLGRYSVKNRAIITLTATLLTVFFGVLSSLVDTGLLSGFFKDFGKRFSIIYIRGIVFYIIQTVCNFALFLGAFRPLANKIDEICPAKFKIKKYNVKMLDSEVNSNEAKDKN
ncbi:MAG: hypothetical protein K2N32_01250 [Clostridia bacterium]|nr:hypothetical protein [Clostridia bacterium]